MRAGGNAGGRRREADGLNDALSSPVGPTQSRRPAGNVGRSVAPAPAALPPAPAPARDPAPPPPEPPAAPTHPVRRPDSEDDDEDHDAVSGMLPGAATSRRAGANARHLPGVHELQFNRTGVSFKLISIIIKRAFYFAYLLFCR